jgi:hypothetical protein
VATAYGNEVPAITVKQPENLTHFHRITLSEQFEDQEHQRHNVKLTGVGQRAAVGPE